MFKAASYHNAPKLHGVLAYYTQATAPCHLYSCCILFLALSLPLLSHLSFPLIIVVGPHRRLLSPGPLPLVTNKKTYIHHVCCVIAPSLCAMLHPYLYVMSHPSIYVASIHLCVSHPSTYMCRIHSYLHVMSHPYLCASISICYSTFFFCAMLHTYLYYARLDQIRYELGNPFLCCVAGSCYVVL